MRDRSGPLGLGSVNIVVVVAGGLTETLQAAPLIAALPTGADRRLVLACPPSAAPLGDHLAGPDEILLVRGLAGRPSLPGLAGLWLALRSRRLDMAVLCSESASVRAAVYMAAIPRRIGCAGGLSDRLLSDRVAPAEDGNRSRSWLGLLRALGLPAPLTTAHLAPGADAVAAAEQLLLSRGVGDGRLLVAIAPGTGFADADVHAWGAERFAHLANRLASRHGAGIILVGDERDRRTADAMMLDLAADTVDLCGEVDLVTTAAVIAQCDLLIGADTPLLHLAAAVGTTSVGLFGPTDGHTQAPAGGEHRVVQALPNGRAAASIDRILVDDVLAGIESAL
jgi:ADP-heptose:LPS heptosyltransferase